MKAMANLPVDVKNDATPGGYTSYEMTQTPGFGQRVHKQAEQN
jgi:hypothetical protein